MGVDVVITARVSVTDEELEAAQNHIHERVGTDVIERLYRDGIWVRAYSLTRYYGPGYERGPWPRIYAAIKAMQGAFPGAPIVYCGDGSLPDEVEPINESDLQKIWARWQSSDWNRYWTQSSDWNRYY